MTPCLRVNHWCTRRRITSLRTRVPVRPCHGADGLRALWGRVLLSLWLRSARVGIPARQVYTPRWAHTDDNHAWVEAWVDGKWYFLGACEPEPVLNLGWFNEPASRGMLMHTKVFGYYEGPEDGDAHHRQLYRNKCDRKLCAERTGNGTRDGYRREARREMLACALASITMRSFIRFHPRRQVRTDLYVYLLASLSAGLGDMVVLAVKDRAFGIQKVSFGKDKEVKLRLEHQVGDTLSFSLDIVPPAGDPTLPEVTPEQRAENDIRFNREDSIRHAYIASSPVRTRFVPLPRKRDMMQKRLHPISWLRAETLRR